MKNTLFFVLVGSLVFGVACSQEQPPEPAKNIPLTTSSSEALDNFEKGRDLFEALRGAESKSYFDQAVEADPNFAMAYMYRGLASSSNKEFFENLKKAVALVDQASDGEQLWIRGFEAGVNGNPAQRGEFFEKLAEVYPEDARAHNNLAGHYNGLQDFDGAISEYKKAIELDPNHSPSYNSLGYALRAVEKYSEAEEAFKKYIDLIPNDPNPYDSYAELMMKMGRYEESISSYKKALEQDSHFPGSHTGIAANLMFMGKHEEARQHMKTYLDQARDDGERRQALFATATIAIDEGNAEEALRKIGEAMALSEAIGDKGSMSGDAQAQGNILFETGNADEAAAHFQESYELAMESNLSDAIKKNVEVGRHQNLAKVALLKKDLDTAKAEAGKFMEGISADNPFQQRTAHELFGLVALAGEDYETAVKHLKQANQQSAYVLYKLAKAQHGAGNKAQCKALCEKVVNLNTLPSLRSAMVRNKAKELAASL